MLPGLRFLFAATTICASLLVFGMGAIALLRASHQQFASAPPRLPPEPVFAQAPQTVPAQSTPTLSLLRVEPAPQAPPLGEILPAEQHAALTSAERAPPVPAPTSSIAEPLSEERGEAPKDDSISRSEAPKPAESQPMPAVTPLAATVDEPQDEPQSTVDTPQLAGAPTVAEPQVTGSIPSPAVPDAAPTATPVIDPPLPPARPQVAALPSVHEAVKKPVAKPALKRRVRHVKRSRPKKERLPAVTSAPTLGSLFGGGN